MVERQTAFKVRIGDLLSGSFVKEAGEFGVGYVLVDGLKVGRVNLLAGVVGRDVAEGFAELSLDDGSGTISARSFDSDFADFEVGDVVNVVGKVREFGGSKFVACEMVGKVDDLAWLELRKLEMEKIGRTKPEFVSADSVKGEVVEEVEEEVVEEKVEEKQKEVRILNPVEKVLSIIRSHDKGDGVDIDDIISEAKVSECERLINSLLAEGDIFEVKPGRVKVLE